jgi:hypothetical protein
MLKLAMLAGAEALEEMDSAGNGFIVIECPHQHHRGLIGIIHPNVAKKYLNLTTF